MPTADPLSFAILAFVGALAGFLNVMAGGGSALTIPLMIFLGYDATVANGSNRIAIQVEAITAVAAFKKKQHADFPMSWKLSLMTLPGGILGAFYAVRIDDALFTKILGVVMILIIFTLVFPKSNVIEHAKTHKWKSWLSWPVMFAVGFYGGFIQAGVGFVIMAVLLHLYGMNLIQTNMHKVFIVMIFTIPAVILFIYTDNVNWFAAIALSIGMMVGTFIAVKMALERGEKFVRIVLGFSLLIIAGKLFLI